MSAPDVTLKLRVIIDPTSTRKIVLPSRPETVSDLLLQLKTSLNVSYDFRVQFEDPEFGNALCDLENIDELPSKATVKLIKTLELGVHSTDVEETAMTSDTPSSYSGRASRWPDVFNPPTFSYDVEFALREGNSDYRREGKHLKLTRDQKHNILERMIDEIYRFKAYPSDDEFSKAAEALVNNHPCLRENGSKTGYDGWKVSLKFKMGNYRSKLRRAGMQEMKKSFALRRKEIVQSSPSVKAMMSRWPALLEEAQDKNDIGIIRTTVLAGLPVYLKEDSADVFKTHKRVELEQAQKAAVAIIAVEEEEEALPFNPQDVLIVLEDEVVMSAQSWVSALVLLFGLLH